MFNHLFLPDVNLEEVKLPKHYSEWLLRWFRSIEQDLENGVISSSRCIQGAFIEIVIGGSIKTDWVGIMNEYLTDEKGLPIAYSEEFGELLNNFNQWKQNTIHSIHARWWLEKTIDDDSDVENLERNIKELIQPSGWIYNPLVSPTRLRGRMRAELMMSLAMGTEILRSGGIAKNHEDVFQALLSSTSRTNFLSAEYFRIKSLEHLGMIQLIPTHMENVIEMCEAGEGYCDFSVTTKVDDYMGSQKRVARDVALHSPISSLHAKGISQYLPIETREHIDARIHSFGNHLKLNPFDIPSFRMRDVDIPFGTDYTPLEIIGASYLIENANDN